MKRKKKMTNKRAKQAAKKVLDAAWTQAEGMIKFPSEEMMPVIREGSELDNEIKLLGKPGVPEGFLDKTKEPARRRKTLYELAKEVKESKAEGSYPKPEPYVPAKDDLNDDLPEFMKESAVQKAPYKARPVQIHRDHTLEIPQIFLAVHVLGDWDVPDDEARFAKMFARAGCKRAKTIEDADLVVFGGGSDIDPALYGEKRHDTTFYSSKRDTADCTAFSKCVNLGIPMFGVCRGAQFLHVANGGKLFQDVDGHYGGHSMWDIKNGKHIEIVSSVHHQMCRENVKGGMEIVATSACSKRRAINNHETSMGANADIEAFFYRDTCCFGVQGHPEYQGYNYFTVWCLEQIHDLFFLNPDLAWTDARVLRVKPDLLAERQALKPAIEIITKA